MKAFKFRYESILRLRIAKEDLAKRDYAQALQKENAARLQLKEIFSAVQSARLSSLDLQKLGGNQGSSLQYIEEYIFGCKKKIQMKEQEIERLAKVKEAKHKVFMEKFRDRKTMEKLKETEMRDYKKVVNKKEVKKIEDQILSGSAGRKQIVE